MTITKTKIFFTIVFIGFLSPFALFGYFYINYEYDVSSLVDYKPSTSSRIYDKNGEKIANIFYKKHRFYAPFEEIPPRAIEALVAIEDTTFFEHPGINVDAIFRAAIKVLKAGKAVQGASTITQQLVKNKLLTREKKLSRKIKEAIFAIKLESILTKEQIIERYLNEIYFGHGYYGIKTAADGYFHKKLQNLTLKEIAILVGLPKAPSTYAPTKNYDISMGRANRVIKRMKVLGWIDDTTYEKSIAERPEVFNTTLTQNKAPFIVDEIARIMKRLGIDDFKTGGYEVYTTIDLRLQDVARKSVKHAYDLSLERIEGYKKRVVARAKRRKQKINYVDTNTSTLNGALVSLEASTGNILALVGSYDYKISSFNRATQAKRQPGSAFKPFIYQVALDLGFSGATELVDIAKTYKYEKDGEEMKWQPRNYSKNYKGLISLREALVHSSNLATINLVNDIGLRSLLKEFSKFGIQNVPQDLSISLGTLTLSPLKLAKYYTSFANQGIQVSTHIIDHIEQNSKTIHTFDTQTKEITTPAQAFLMTSILKSVVDRGTGIRARVRGIDIAGKTGTTNDTIDGWFSGYSPTISTVVWFGNDNNTPMHKKETGGRVAGPAFNMFYTNLIKLYPQIQRKFTRPEGVIEVEMNGKKEYFTNISRPPRVEMKVDPEEELLF
ncbi:PBP1A family penicillin-binding protein [Sulfurimonas sp. SAG-AH-194-I05]|nr:PBP1A family penicillin-binding protein [Sulfurimonas sp. SAG-AH-194-I05]MDF1874199.1 PBP1A family penicillin-binding protein [Sulfurimonas sp. SAG-AH-194-I05]